MAARNHAVRSGYEFVEGWGMATGAKSKVLRPRTVEEVQACFKLARQDGTTLALRGTGCSYGDASVTSDGHVLDIGSMKRILDFNESTGIADCEGGVTIEHLWKHSLPRGYWPSVCSGTMFPTLAGAAGMNIHGKNNFKVGTIGDSILEFDIVLPNGELRTCSREAEADLFHAAIGGFGMLGCFTRIKIKTKRIYSGDIEVKGISCHNLAEMMEYCEEHQRDADYLVGWIDCFGAEENMGRGLIHHARYLPEGADSDPTETLRVDYQELPGMIMGVFPKGEVWRILRLFNNDLGMRLINYAKHQAGRFEGMQGWHRQSHAGFNFLLDYVPNWKFAYGRSGRNGLIQYQTFLPKETAHDVYSDILHLCQRRGIISYLGVLKRHRPDPFWMTHSVDGWSLALDFKVTPAKRAELWALCDEMTRIVLEGGGKFYFAKDLVIGPRAAQSYFPEESREAFMNLKQNLDPDSLLQTDLWRRVFTQSEGFTAPA
ncbi:MAG: decaprenylphospho-beta-D-ribofuranose 2-oxidase [Planctomycetota bacterium]|jgi:decaprenylphospho-beta-D-ribofuranose 2-oxidase